jgi:hypothetical protein
MEATTNPKRHRLQTNWWCVNRDIARKFSPKNYADPTHIRRVLDQDGRVFGRHKFRLGKDSKVSKSLLLTVDCIYGLLSTNKHSDTKVASQLLRPSKKVRNSVLQAWKRIQVWIRLFLLYWSPSPYYHAIEGSRHLPRLEANRPESEPPLLQLQAHGDRK